MRTVNKAILVGVVGRDPDAVGDGVALVSLATKDDEDRTEWHRLEFRGKLAEFVGEQVRKDTRLYIEGRMSYDCYERDGVTIPTATVIVRDVVVLSRGGAAVYSS